MIGGAPFFLLMALPRKEYMGRPRKGEPLKNPDAISLKGPPYHLNGAKRRQKGTGCLQREKTGFYTMRICRNGQRLAKGTGTKDFAEAQRILEAFVAPFVAKDRVLALKMIQKEIGDIEERSRMEEENRRQMLLSDAWLYYVDSCRRKAVTDDTLFQKGEVWKNFVEWIGIAYGTDLEVRGVTPAVAESYLRFIRPKVASTTWNGRLCYLREIYRIVMEKARAKVNPFDGIPLLPEDCHSRRALTNEEVKLLLKEAAKVRWDYRVLFLIAIYTGQRLGDCCRLKWDQINLEQNIIQLIPAKTRRTARGRMVTIPIHCHLRKIFLATTEADRNGFFLKEIANNYIEKRHQVAEVLKRIFKAAGIVTTVRVEGRTNRVPHATFHSLRHTFVSIAANSGVPIHIIQSIVGHESRAMTWHYYHENETALREAVNAIPSFDDSPFESKALDDEVYKYIVLNDNQIQFEKVGAQ